MDSGKNWSGRQFGDCHIVSIKNHGELTEALQDFCSAKKITAGSITGIGAVSRAALRFFDPATKQYADRVFEEQMEIVNLTGNISTMDGKSYLHLHVTLGDSEYRARAGHLLSAVISGAGEFIVQSVPGKAERTFNAETGLNFYDFNK